MPHHAQRTTRLVATGLVAALAAAGCSGDGGRSAKAAPAEHAASIEMTAGPVSVASAGAPMTLPDAVRDQVVNALKQYVQVATVDPLRTGKAAGDLTPMFTADALARAQGPDRAVLVDEGLPKATTDVVAKAQPVALTALADGSGGIVLVNANLVVTVDTTTGKGPVKIQRSGDVVFTPTSGAWKALGFDLQAARSGRGVDAAAATTDTKATR